jgi:hypothetical protein
MLERGKMDDLAVEKAAQIEGAKVVLKPLIFIVAAIVFVLCYWRYDVGLALSIGAAVLTYPVLGFVLAVPAGYVLGKRAARRHKMRCGKAKPIFDAVAGVDQTQ